MKQKQLSYPKNKMKVLLLENINIEAINAFKKEGYDVEALKKALSEKELLEKIANVSILGIRSKTEITKKIILNADKLLTVGAFCIGTNQIDVLSASRKGVAVFNAPYSNTRSVVEMVIAEIIALYRNLFDQSSKVHLGIWNKSAEGSHEIRGRTLGIVGYGNIGTQLSVLAESLGMNVLFYDTSDKLSLGNAKKCDSLEELLENSDIVSIHVDGAKKNTNLIGAEQFALMKDGVIFINASRGHIVDIDALVAAIKSGKVAGCAVDVFPYEPKANNESFESPLQGLQNVILTPHIGGSTEESQQNIAEFVSSKLSQFIDSGNTTLSVNFPQIQLPDYPNSHRFLHIHKNVPGMLAKINTVLARENVNIDGQYLKTNEDIGYVISDINKDYNKSLIQKLKKIPGTIKLRVLY
jgi:D-3-phosphoglycerate dehydrogenase / 2-oxoglutarate reductase